MITPSAVILSAGYASRMGRFKPLLDLGDKTALDRVVSLYLDAGITDVRVVTGYRAGDIRAALADRPVRIVHNPDHDSGMFSSVLAGVNDLPSAVPAFFVHPVDIPLVRTYTVVTLMAAMEAKPAAVIYPRVGDERGHPPLIHGSLKAAIAAHDGSGGLKALLDRFEAQARDVPVADEGALLDMDTPDDFRQLGDRLAGKALLTENECRLLMEQVRRLPAEINEHCRQVARVAESLAAAVNAAGGHLDAALIRCAARVHDVARLEKHHADAGAALLRRMGFDRLAAIVAVHMDLTADEHSLLDEAEVVYLADKLVAGTTIVGLARRFDAKLKKYAQDPQVTDPIQRRKRAAVAIQTKIERLTGKTIDHILPTAIKE
ncbi:molybdopterin-guanine dinucleotide biosynthesis protein MobA [Desulfosarcina ovata subsp. sediminis]|uniref:Molybdopterin-guanine dinucleotide biosynthesis protein MobA n=1 Tax=Desulfosarcina ovata subsp. sediminis TaxID=885957 RepID=A0A5K8A1S6_9BACT|nr:NTP transferase domain-containing protein [Desulfosarcina ovata]BBO86391.1 molybdopterin-guanine dinucleotide biosynthesis protein MobA [Desulfosarcina ovata subsp. sediminis]